MARIVGIDTDRIPRLPLTVTYRIPDLLAVVLVAFVVTLWASLAGRAPSPLVFVPCLAALAAFYFAGSLVAGWKRVSDGVAVGLPTRLVAGYALVNTALFVLAWVSPLGIVANFGAVFVLVAALFVAARPVNERGTFHLRDDGTVALLALVFCLLAASLWCQDAIRPPTETADAVTYRSWIDGFYHAVHLRIFGAGHGAASLEDFRLAGVPTRLYHYGVYLTPAFIKQASGLSSYAAFAGVLSPLGVFLTGLGAYVLGATLWGRWSGVAACVALMALPDGSQQGMHNAFMSFHWLTQISPSATVGLSLVALSWAFVLRGCLQGRFAQVLAGWVVGGILIAYKAHFFIASALVLILVPPVFFRAPLGLRKRVAWAGVALAAYAGTLAIIRGIPGLPLIRFDGSGFRLLLGMIATFTSPGAMRNFVVEYVGKDQSILANLAVGAPFALLAAFGLFLPLLGYLLVRTRGRMPTLFWIFPVLVFANFVAMFLGLALDMDSSTPDELSHRPVMLAYFLVVAWTGGAAGLLVSDSQRIARMPRAVLWAVAGLFLLVPLAFGSGVQRLPALSRISPPHNLPPGLVQAARYIREHSTPRDLVQDSLFDRYCALAALSERRMYVARSQTNMWANIDKVDERVGAVERFMAVRDAYTVALTAKRLGITWFLLQPGQQVAWAAPIANKPVFELAGFRLYRF